MRVVYYANIFKRVQDYILADSNIYIPLEDIQDAYENSIRGLDGFSDVPVYYLSDKCIVDVAKYIIKNMC